MLTICNQFMETNFGEIRLTDKAILNVSMDDFGPEDTVSSRLNRVIYLYIAPVIIGVGVVGDLLTIATLTHPSLKRKDIYIFLTFLAITDLIAQLSVIPPILWILDYRFCSRSAAVYYAHIAFPMANALMGASVWVVVLLTLYQFRAVRYPLRLSTAQMDRRLVYCLFALSFLANFCIYAPWAFKKVIYQVPPGILRCPLVICDRNMEDAPWFHIYEWVREFLTRLLPFVLIAYFNVTILVTYRTNKKDRLTLSSQSFHRKAVVEKSEKEEKRLFALLFAITIIFFLCTIPAAPVTIFISDQQSQSLPFQIFRSAANLLEITKFALNFYLYCLINPDIRRVCLRVLKCRGWSPMYERVSSGHTMRTITSLPNSRSGSNKTILTVRNGSDRSSRGSRRSRNSHLAIEEDQRDDPSVEGTLEMVEQQYQMDALGKWSRGTWRQTSHRTSLRRSSPRNTEGNQWTNLCNSRRKSSNWQNQL